MYGISSQIKKEYLYIKGKVTQIYDDPMGAKMTAIAVDKPCKELI